MSDVSEKLEHVVRLMVDQPEEIEIDEIPHQKGTAFELRVAEEDLGKVIGRQGRTARALRTLLSAREERDGERYSLEIIDDSAVPVSPAGPPVAAARIAKRRGRWNPSCVLIRSLIRSSSAGYAVRTVWPERWWSRC